jgi:predicted transcriptional regulator
VNQSVRKLEPCVSASETSSSESFQLRILDILDHVAFHGPTTLSAISQALDLPKSSVSRSLSKLLSKGWVERDLENQSYIISPQQKLQVEEATSYAPSLHRFSEKMQDTFAETRSSFAIYALDTSGERRTIASNSTTLLAKNLPRAELETVDVLISRSTGRASVLSLFADRNVVRGRFTRTAEVLWDNAGITHRVTNSAILPLMTACNTPAALKLAQGTAPDFPQVVDAARAVMRSADITWVTLRSYLDS